MSLTRTRCPVRWPWKNSGPTIAEACHQRAAYLWLVAEGNRHLKWREVAEVIPGLVPKEHRKLHKWGYWMLEIWGQGVRQTVQRHCLHEGKVFPWRE